MSAKLTALLALLLAVVSLSSCKEMTESKDKSEHAVADFHQQFNQQKFKEIHAAGNAEFKAAEPEADFVELLTAMHRKLGRHVKTARDNWRFSSINGKTTVTITQHNEFEHGKGVETFVFTVSGGTCVLQSYHIESWDMMIK